MQYLNKWLRYAVLFVVATFMGCSSPEEKVEKYLQSGQSYFSQGSYVKADLEFRNALQINQNLVEAWYGMAQIAEKQAKWQKAYKLLSRVIELDSAHIQAHITFGKINLAAGKLDKALEESDIALKLAPDNADVRAFRAAVLYKLSDTEGAVQEANLALENDSGHVDALLVLATERLAANDAKKAIEFLNRGLKKNEQNVALQIVKVRAFNQIKDLDQAVEIFHKLIKFYPENKAFNKSLARLYIENEKWDEAEKIYRDLSMLDSTNIEAKLNVVRFLMTFRGATKAEKQLIAYIESTPDEYKYRFTLADFYLQIEKVEKSKQIYGDILIKDGNGVNGLLAKNRLAMLALSDGDKPLASKLIQEIVAVEPRNTEALIFRANLALERRDTDKAISDLRVVLRDEPGSVDALRALAKAHLQSGSLEQAKDQYIRAIQSNPANTKVSLEYAQLLLREQSNSRAEEVLQNFLVRVPNNLNGLQLLAQIKLGQQDWAAAQALAEQIRAIEGGEAVSNQVMGVAFQGRQQYDESIEAFQRAHKASPSAVQPLVALVQTYVRAGKNQAAEQFLNSVLKADEDNIFAHVLIGRLHFINKKPAKAERAFRTAISKNPEDILGYTSLAALFLQGEKLEEASAVVKQGLDKIPKNMVLRVSLASLHEKSGDIEEAIDVYKAILQENPNIDVAANNLAALLSEYRDDQASKDRALKLAERFRHTKIPYFQDTLGWVYYQVGKHDEAAPLLQKAVEALPEFPVFRYHLGMSYLADDQKQKAKEELEESLRLSGSDFPEAEKARKILGEL